MSGAVPSERVDASHAKDGGRGASGHLQMRVVVALGQRLVLDVVCRMLMAAPHIEVVAATTLGREAVAFASSSDPDLIVLDLDLAGLSGLGVAQQVRAAGIATPIVLLLNTTQDAYHLAAAYAAGVRGFVLKQGTVDELLQALRVVREGGTYFDGQLTKAMLTARGFGGSPDGCVFATAASAELTTRETEVIRLVAFGFTSKEIAHQLGIATKSAETYKARASEKLRLATRAEIVRYAIVQGWFA
jgi:DNA-binding NarL/FixJ family response regulator